MYEPDNFMARMSNRCAWLLLVLVTIASVALAELPDWRKVAFPVVFAASVIKGQIVATKFMETDRALPIWNVLYRVWILAMGIVLCGGVYLAGNFG